MKMTEEEEKKEQLIKEQLAKEQLVSDYKNTFGSPEGERVLGDLKRLANIDFSIIPLNGNGQIDINQVMVNEGQRAVVIHILRKISVDLDKPKQTEAVKE